MADRLSIVNPFVYGFGFILYPLDLGVEDGVLGLYEGPAYLEPDPNPESKVHEYCGAHLVLSRKGSKVAFCVEFIGFLGVCFSGHPPFLRPEAPRPRGGRSISFDRL